MSRSEPMTYQRAATGVVRGRIRLRQAGEEIRLALDVLQHGNGSWPTEAADPAELRPELEGLLAGLSELERRVRDAGRRW